MRKGFRSFCSGDASTSTLVQHRNTGMASPCDLDDSTAFESSPPTLEQMILRLEFEEKMARKARLDDDYTNRRMSCFNNSDILRSARNALNQYPRFSLDGRDAMYRSSFRNLASGDHPCRGRKSVCCGEGVSLYDSNLGKVTSLCGLPQTLAGESVVWHKPGVVAKLMGLEAMPVPVNGSRGRVSRQKHLSSAVVRKQRLQSLRRRCERQEMERIKRGSYSSRGKDNNNSILLKPFVAAPAAETDNIDPCWPTHYKKYDF
ncbi:DUF3741-associated sequence motif [Dillenia turbinata]|uniref:DUF3741-associated sequence motif n=1 Tax=Dillenia turbinata TaxID=194707 RepID=A0AAN8V4Q0_9MAGN